MTGSTRILILGAGYTGRHCYATVKGQGRQVLASSRDPSKHLPYASLTDRIEFDLTQQATWKNIPSAADMVWCFPATPLAQVRAFAKTLGAPPRRIVVLSSTSAYVVKNDSKEYPPPWIDESAPINLTKPRVQGEEFLRTNCGAIVLRVAGIYGPGRNPLDWIRQGRVGSSRKYVNLIHAEDLAAICLLALEHGKPGEAYNVSDGQPHTWNEICVTAQQRWAVTAGAAKEDHSWGKRISNAKLRAELGCVLRYPDLYEALALIESGDGVEAQDGQNGFQRGPRREGTGGVSFLTRPPPSCRDSSFPE
jgi:nucleoside-diphosphate-sugar epimerase